MQDGDWAAAADHFERALELHPELAGARERLAEALVRGGEPDRAKLLLDDLLQMNPEQLELRLLRGRALFAIGEYASSADDFAAAIRLSKSPSPTLYLEHAHALLECDKKSDRALAALDNAVTSLGPLVVLVDRALLLLPDQPERQLVWLAKLPAPSRNAPHYRLKRALALRELQRLAEAQTEVTAALEELAALPSSRRDTEAVVELHAQLATLQHNLKEAAASRETEDWRWLGASIGVLVIWLLVRWRR